MLTALRECWLHECEVRHAPVRTPSPHPNTPHLVLHQVRPQLRCQLLLLDEEGVGQLLLGLQGRPRKNACELGQPLQSQSLEKSRIISLLRIRKAVPVAARKMPFQLGQGKGARKGTVSHSRSPGDTGSTGVRRPGAPCLQQPIEQRFQLLGRDVMRHIQLRPCKCYQGRIGGEH